MERSVISLSILVLCCLVPTATAQTASNVNAYSIEYEAEERNWDMKAAHVFCATLVAHRPLEWRSKYNWTAFCGPVGPHGQEACGKCLNVSYVGIEATVTATVRIVDTCGSGLELDKPVFDQLDIDEVGPVIGHLNVSYTFVDCGDPEIRLYSGQ